MFVYINRKNKQLQFSKYLKYINNATFIKYAKLKIHFFFPENTIMYFTNILTFLYLHPIFDAFVFISFPHPLNSILSLQTIEIHDIILLTLSHSIIGRTI